MDKTLVGLIKGLARDLGPRGITINNIQPGQVDTDLNPATGDFAKMLISVMALPRYGSGDEIASLVAYLASPEAAFVTGGQSEHRWGIYCVALRPPPPETTS